jgi:hypothetical protein
VIALVGDVRQKAVGILDDRIIRSRPGVLAALAIAAVLACAGCGSPTDVSVIRNWAAALAAGDLDKAASYFALPAIVANDTPPVRITTRAEARKFNELLPCGGQVVATARHAAYIYATFRLTNRPGGDCGAGTGGLAATAFLIRNGKIAEWRRLPNPGGGQPTPTTPTPTPGQGPAV